jgi:hypothetical protein
VQQERRGGQVRLLLLAGGTFTGGIATDSLRPHLEGDSWDNASTCQHLNLCAACITQQPDTAGSQRCSMLQAADSNSKL